MGGLFDSEKPDTSKLQLSEYKRPVKKVVEIKKVEKRINKVSNESVPAFHDQELRKKLFPNNPPKKSVRTFKDTGKIRWVDGKYYTIE